MPGWTQQIYRDTNCNGVLDGAENAAVLVAPVAVNPGDAVCIIVRDNIPGAAPYNAQNVITITATAVRTCRPGIAVASVLASQRPLG